MTIRPPFAYFGGKINMAPKIAALLPAHHHYVEPFAGSLAVLLAKQPAHMETVNDLSGDLMTFWRVLRDQPEDLARACALTPHSRAEHQAAFDRDGLPDIEAARRVWVALTQGRAGRLDRTGWRHSEDAALGISVPDYLRGYVARMAPAAERLADVSLECLPALDLIVKYGKHPEVCLYVDPPYLGSTRSGRGYAHEMTSTGDHADLLDALRDCSAAVVLSGYASALYDEFLRDWERLDFDTQTAQGGKRKPRTEVLWSNRSLAHDLFTEDLA
jgi:DNA adenine methylase